MSKQILAGSLFVSTSFAFIAGCSSGSSGQSEPEPTGDGERVVLRSARTVKTPQGKDPLFTRKSRAPDGHDLTCPNPLLGSVRFFGMVSLSGTVVNRCLSGDTTHCNVPVATFLDENDVALDYGNFPFSRVMAGRFFYAVVARGFEAKGFFQGATGNLSDDVPSVVPGDLGNGDTLADRTIVVSQDQVTQLVPASHGTHAVSFPPSQFATIQLAPFDTTPEGRYVLALCPIAARSRCDCAFEAFAVLPQVRDGGASGAGGASGTGGASGAGGASGTGGVSGAGGRDAAAEDAAHAAGGAAHDGGVMCPDM